MLGSDITEEEIQTYSTVWDGQHICQFVDCGYRSSFRKDMRKHLRSHLKIKPYRCRFCTYTATQKSNVFGHISRAHGHALFQKSILEYNSR